MKVPHIPSDLGTYASLAQQQLTMALLSVLFGLLLALPTALACVRWNKTYPPILTAATIFYSIPSLAIFVILIDYTGITETTVIIPLSLYTLAILIPNIVDGLRAVPEDVRLAATAMGFSGLRRLIQVDLPLAVPAIMAGIRVAAVGNISMVSVGALIGVGAFGEVLTRASQLGRFDLAWAGVISILVLALAVDLLLVLAQRLLTPWTRRRRT